MKKEDKTIIWIKGKYGKFWHKTTKDEARRYFAKCTCGTYIKTIYATIQKNSNGERCVFCHFNTKKGNR